MSIIFAAAKIQRIYELNARLHLFFSKKELFIRIFFVFNKEKRIFAP